MTAKRGEMVELFSEELNHKQEFELEHAQNILSNPKNSAKQWALPSNSKYHMDRGKIVKRASNRTAESSKESDAGREG